MSDGGTRLLSLAPCADLATASERVADALASADARRGEDLARAAWLRIEQPFERGSVLGWLRAQAPLPRLFWASRDGTFLLASAGIAEEVDSADFGALDALVERFASGDAEKSARVFATARFDMEREPDATWAAFKRVYAQVPLLELRGTRSGSLLAVNLKAGEGLRTGWYDAQRRIASKAVLSGRSHPPAVEVPALVPVPSDAGRDAWRERVEILLAQVEAGRLHKAVLAREERYAAARDVEPLALLGELAERRKSYPFLVQPTPRLAFLGASPERLYKREGRTLWTEALAGTRPRGATRTEDANVAATLVSSEKDGHEHELVRRHIVDALAPLTSGIQCPTGPEVRSLPHLHHLHTPLEATLNDGVTDADLLRALHPTPAVCGMPRDAALSFIRATEGFDRGLYAGPIGCFGRDEAECAVAIRSALVTGRDVRLYAGAGIVEGSDADAEWDETVQKMKPFEATLGLGDVA